MKDYVSFKEEVVKRLKNFLPEEFRDYDLEVELIPKVNGCKEAIIISKHNSSDPTPNIYLDQLYDQYELCGDMDKILKFAAEFYMYGVNYGKAMAECMDMEGKNDHIIMMLINTKNNKELLKTVPHRNVMDLSIIYRWMMALPDGSFNTATVTNDFADKHEITEKTLYELAMENTKRLLPPSVQELEADINVLSNERGIIGAAAMLYEHQLAKIAETQNSDLYVIPSSIHEVITVPISDADPDHLSEMVMDANRTVLKAADILSDNLYYYSRDEQALMMAKEVKGICEKQS